MPSTYDFVKSHAIASPLWKVIIEGEFALLENKLTGCPHKFSNGKHKVRLDSIQKTKVESFIKEYYG